MCFAIWSKIFCENTKQNRRGGGKATTWRKRNSTDISSEEFIYVQQWLSKVITICNRLKVFNALDNTASSMLAGRASTTTTTTTHVIHVLIVQWQAMTDLFWCLFHCAFHHSNSIPPLTKCIGLVVTCCMQHRNRLRSFPISFPTIFLFCFNICCCCCCSMFSIAIRNLSLKYNLSAFTKQR